MAVTAAQRLSRSHATSRPLKLGMSSASLVVRSAVFRGSTPCTPAWPQRNLQRSDRGSSFRWGSLAFRASVDAALDYVNGVIVGLHALNGIRVPVHSQRRHAAQSEALRQIVSAAAGLQQRLAAAFADRLVGGWDHFEAGATAPRTELSGLRWSLRPSPAPAFLRRAPHLERFVGLPLASRQAQPLLGLLRRQPR